MKVLVDSDVLIEVGRGRNPGIQTRWLALANSSALVYYTPVTASELWRGVRPNEVGPLRELLGSMTCVEINCEIGRLAGGFMKGYTKSHGLELADALIAASAVVHRASLWTRNRKHYPMKDVSFFE